MAVNERVRDVYLQVGVFAPLDFALHQWPQLRSVAGVQRGEGSLQLVGRDVLPQKGIGGGWEVLQKLVRFLLHDGVGFVLFLAKYFLLVGEIGSRKKRI